MLYVPALSDVLARVSPVATLVALMLAFGTSAPCSSTTVPVMDPVICCAFEDETHAINNAATKRQSRNPKWFLRFLVIGFSKKVFLL
jgi:hypothetical protein